MEEQLGAEFMQVALRLEGCCLVGPCGSAGPSDPAAPRPSPIQSPDQRTSRDTSPETPTFQPGHFKTPTTQSGDPGGGGGRGRQGGMRTQAAQGLQGCCGQRFVEDGHGPQLTLQGGGAAPARVLGACQGGADAALLGRGPQPRPPAQPCRGRDGLRAGEGGVSGGEGGGDRWRRQPRGGGCRAVASRADAAGREGLRGRGEGGKGGVSSQPSPGSTSIRRCTVAPRAAQTPEAPDPTLSRCPQTPKASPNPARCTSEREGQRRGTVLTRWPSL